jgi:flagellar basal body-associated protein FliL
MADENTAVAEEQQPKSNKMLIIIIVAVLNVALIGGVFFMLAGNKQTESAAPAPAEKHKKRHSAGVADGPILELPGFVVNLNNEDGPKYLKVKVSLQLDTQEDAEPFEKQKALVRNELLLQLSSLDIETSKTIKGKREIEKRLTEAVNERLDADIVSSVFFTEFVTQ